MTPRWALVACLALAGTPTQAIAEIRYLDIGNAAQRFHNRATGPVILVTLRVEPHV